MLLNWNILSEYDILIAVCRIGTFYYDQIPLSKLTGHQTGGKRVMNMSWKRGACALTITAILTGCSATEAAQNTETIQNIDSLEAGIAKASEDADVSAAQGQEAAGTSETAMPPASGTIPLTVWAEEADFEMLGGMLASFKDYYAGQASFEITLVPQADSGTCNMILDDIHSAGDIFSFPDDQFTRLMAAGILEPVDNADAVSAANVPEAVAAASWHDTLYAFPYTADNGYFLYYDKTYFSEQDVQTLDGLLAAAAAAEKQISMELNSGWYLYAFFGQTGLELGINSDNVTNYCNWNTTEGPVKGTDIAQSILNLTTNPAFSSNTDGDFIAKVQDGSVIAGISGTWNATKIKNAWGKDYGAVKLPTFTCAGRQIQMSSFTGYKMMGVNAYSPHKEWAMKLADWLTNEENQYLRFVEKNQVPSNSNAAASDAAAQIPAVQAILEQSQYGNLQRVGVKYWDACTDFANIMIEGNPNNISLQQLMYTLTEGITASIAE